MFHFLSFSLFSRTRQADNWMLKLLPIHIMERVTMAHLPGNNEETTWLAHFLCRLKLSMTARGRILRDCRSALDGAAIVMPLAMNCRRAKPTSVTFAIWVTLPPVLTFRRIATGMQSAFALRTRTEIK
jgi:hypothetical protein